MGLLFIYALFADVRIFENVNIIFFVINNQFFDNQIIMFVIDTFRLGMPSLKYCHFLPLFGRLRQVPFYALSYYFYCHFVRPDQRG